MEGFFKVGQTECGIMSGVHISGPAPTAAQKGPPHMDRLARVHKHIEHHLAPNAVAAGEDDPCECRAFRSASCLPVLRVCSALLLRLF